MNGNILELQNLSAWYSEGKDVLSGFSLQLIAGYKEFGMVLFSSHILESITLTSDRVLVLEDGHIRQSFEGSQINADTIREALHDENEF